MTHRFEEALPVLQRTPRVLEALLAGLPEAWTEAAEGPNTWSPFEVVVHLIHGERVNWIPRIEHLLRDGEGVPFPPFDREAGFSEARGVPLRDLLAAFADLRAVNLDRLAALGLTEADLLRRGRHPQLGGVTLDQLLATWVAHDLNHLGQVTRILARRYAEAVGPWRAFLPLLGPAQG